MEQEKQIGTSLLYEYCSIYIICINLPRAEGEYNRMDRVIAHMGNVLYSQLNARATGRNGLPTSLAFGGCPSLSFESTVWGNEMVWISFGKNGIPVQIQANILE